VSNLVAVDRLRVDACPGALTVHQAADGGLARVRLPGGLVTGAQLDALADAADALGDGRVELTSRGNVQLRALPAGAQDELGERLAAAGLLPSATHERVRNILASALAGVDASTELEDLARELDRALCSRPRLVELPGRFLFALDDGRGDVATLEPDVLAQAAAVPGDAGYLVAGLSVARRDVVGLMLAVAEAFLDERAAQHSKAWRIAELAGGLDVVLRRVQATRPGLVLAVSRPRRSAAPGPVGVIDQPDGRQALVVLAPLGRLSATQLRALATYTAARGARVTAWRSIVLPDLADAAPVATSLTTLGLGVDAASPWYRVSACAGRPGCARALADVQTDARLTANSWPVQRTHWSGCGRRCGRPHDTEIDVVATEAGYLTTAAEGAVAEIVVAG
jgi:precorrin-3B synthase